MNIDKGEIINSIKERIYFDQDAHLRAKNHLNPLTSDEVCSDKDESPIKAKSKQDPLTSDNVSSESDESELESVNTFQRRFENPDMATCWLNACLQMMLCAMDQDISNLEFNSELGLELKRLQVNSESESLDPTYIKDIIVTSEDTRIATRLSELQSEGLDPVELKRRSQIIQNFRLDMRGGQQCVRDFFVLLNENLVDWPDVYSFFSFSMVTSVTCSRCKAVSSSESTKMYEELDVPPDSSNLTDFVEEFFNGVTKVHTYCQDGCKVPGEASRRTILKSTQESQFIILLFSRYADAGLGYQLLPNRVVSTGNIDIR